jgi:uncharacterized protein
LAGSRVLASSLSAAGQGRPASRVASARTLGVMQHRFRADVERNPANSAILSRWKRVELPEPWLVAGCLFQTVWNLQAGRPPHQDIKDYDIFYFDASDLSQETERQAQAHLDSLLGDLGIVVEVANQARVHLWYEQFFGHTYSPLGSSEDGIRKFLVRETCVGIRPGQYFAPYGLEGLYAGTLTPNPLVPHHNLFERKVATYRQRWDWLRVHAERDDA